MTPKHFSISTRHTLPIIFAVCLVLGIWGVNNISAQAASARVFCMQSEMQNAVYADGLNNRNSQPQSCCCGSNKNCFELPERAFLASPRVKTPAPANVLPIIANAVPSPGLPKGLTNKLWNFGMGPPVPFYILNLSLLC